MTTDIHVVTRGERRAPGRAINIGSQSGDEQPTVLRAETLELKTRAGGGNTTTLD